MAPSLLPFLLVLGVFGLSACTADCKPPGYVEGERFQLTVLSRASGACTVAPLAAGDSFILTGGAARRDPDLCTVRGASPAGGCIETYNVRIERLPP